MHSISLLSYKVFRLKMSRVVFLNTFACWKYLQTFLCFTSITYAILRMPRLHFSAVLLKGKSNHLFCRQYLFDYNATLIQFTVNLTCTLGGRGDQPVFFDYG